MNTLDGWLSRIEQVFLWFACAALIGIMMVMVMDVSMRYAFNAPLRWAYEVLTRYLLLAVFFFAVSAVLHRGDHLSVDLFAKILPRRVMHFSLSVLYFAAGLVWSVACYKAFLKLQTNWLSSALVPGIGWPVWTSTLIIVTGIAVLVLRIVLMTMQHVRGIFEKRAEGLQ